MVTSSLYSQASFKIDIGDSKVHNNQFKDITKLTLNPRTISIGLKYSSYHRRLTPFLHACEKIVGLPSNY